MKCIKFGKILRKLSLICLEYLFAPWSWIHTTIGYKKLWVRAAYSRFCRLINTRNKALRAPSQAIAMHLQFQHNKGHPFKFTVQYRNRKSANNSNWGEIRAPIKALLKDRQKCVT